MELSEEQVGLLESLGLPVVLDGLGDEELCEVEEALEDAMQYRGINDAGDGLNAYGELCRSVIVSMPDK